MHITQTLLRNVSISKVLGLLSGSFVVILPVMLKPWGVGPLGPILGIILIVASLFGELPQIAVLQKLGAWMSKGIIVATIMLLIPFIMPQGSIETSLLAWSPIQVWLPYLSIVIVGISFSLSLIPHYAYVYCLRTSIPAYIVVPGIVIVAGMSGNILDGVTVIAVSGVLFFYLLPKVWATTACFTLLFGGLVSNFLTVAAEPTNIKYQEVLADYLPNNFWQHNWIVSLLGVILPSLFLAWEMHKAGATWRNDEEEPSAFRHPQTKVDNVFSTLAILCLAGGIIIHAIINHAILLGILLLPAGVFGLIHLRKWPNALLDHVREQWYVWICLGSIFSLLWYVTNVLTAGNVLSEFFNLPEPLQLGVRTLIALLSSVTDNVAVSAILGTMIKSHPVPIWDCILMLILLTWSGGLTPFGCLQSLALNAQIKFSPIEWLRWQGKNLLYCGLALAGSLIGLVITIWLYY